MGGNFAILNPCQKKWSDLAGEGRIRYCDLCKKNVHALDEYSREERGALWSESGGYMCVMIAAAAPEPMRTRREILVGALLTAISPLFAQSNRLRIRVTDITGAAVPNAAVTIEKTEIKATTDGSGEAILNGLPLGDSQVSIAVPGFMTFRQTITVRSSEEQKLEATLQVGGMMGEVVTVVKGEGPEYTAGYMASPKELDLPSPSTKPVESH